MASLFTNGRFQAFDAVGVPIPNGTLTTYVSGTTTPKATYTDATLGTPNTNPVVLNSRGEAQVWLGSGPYTMLLKDASGVAIWSLDGIQDPGDASSALSTTLAAPSGSSLIGFQQSEGGSVPTTEETKLREQLHAVNDFGCDATGATNTTTKLKAFYDACIASGKRGHIPKGTYKVTPDVLKFTATTFQPWPHITTDGHKDVIFQVDTGTGVNAPVLAWNNGTQTGSSPTAQWRGGSHGGITVIDPTSDTAPLRASFSFGGMWGTKFGYLLSSGSRGDGAVCPMAVVGTDPDAYAASFLYFDMLEVQNAQGFGMNNRNGVGMDSWRFENFYFFGCKSGGMYGCGDGMYWVNGSIANCNGYAIDDGDLVHSALGGGNRNTYGVVEIDNCEYGIRINRSWRMDYQNVRINCRYQTAPNASAIYWPVTAVMLADGDEPSVKDVNMNIVFRIEAGGLLANIGTFVNANNTGNVTDVKIHAIYFDNGGPLGITDAMIYKNFTNTVAYCTVGTREMIDTRDKALVYGRGSVSTSIPNSGFGGATPIAFPANVFPDYSSASNYDPATSKWTAPRKGLYRWDVSLPLAVAIGTRIRIGAMANGSLSCESIQWAVNAATTHYKASGHCVLDQGQVLYITADQNTAGAVACSPVVSNDEVRFVVTVA